jgi:hypothetical protein
MAAPSDRRARLRSIAMIAIFDVGGPLTALASSKIMPLAFAAVLAMWTFGYGQQQRRKGEQIAARFAAEAASSAQDAGGPATES